MAASVRLSKEEQKLLEKKYLEIASKQIKQGVRPIKESNLVHFAVRTVMPFIDVDDDGNLYVSTNFETG